MSHEGVSDYQPPEDDQVDTLAFLVVKAFDKNPDNIYLTNRTRLEHLLPNAGELREDDVPNHQLIPYTQIPLDDRQLYPEPPIGIEEWGNFMVWYPPLTKEEIEQHSARKRDEISQRVERKFGILLADLTGNTTVCSVADYIARMKAQQLKTLNESS